MVEQIDVADAKRRFSELADRVANGESFLIVNRGRPVLALVPPQRLGDDEVPPVGLAAFAGALAGDWDSVDDDMGEIVATASMSLTGPRPASCDRLLLALTARVEAVVRGAQTA